MDCLIEALHYILEVLEIEDVKFCYLGSETIPIVETYIKLCKGMANLGNHKSALEYATGAYRISQ